MITCKCGKEFKSSQSLNAHTRWCLIYREGKPIIGPPNRGKVSPHKGLSYEEIVGQQRAVEIKEKLSLSAKKVVVSNETKEKLSLSRLKVLENSPHIKWYEVDGVKVQGEWEKSVAEKLRTAGLSFIRKRLKYDTVRHYTPDFYIPELDVFIEVKGWLRTADIVKYQKVVQEHPLKVIKILHGKEKVFNFDVSKLLELPNLKDVI